ncbi:hypothetical protein C8F01DRAFT_1090394 [Mycena amicta]|nr:hypothetical protein C8F01DRAFT_1090394 [Mycena amicta]
MTVPARANAGPNVELSPLRQRGLLYNGDDHGVQFDQMPQGSEVSDHGNEIDQERHLEARRFRAGFRDPERRYCVLGKRPRNSSVSSVDALAASSEFIGVLYRHSDRNFVKSTRLNVSSSSWTVSESRKYRTNLCVCSVGVRVVGSANTGERNSSVLRPLLRKRRFSNCLGLSKAKFRNITRCRLAWAKLSCNITANACVTDTVASPDEVWRLMSNHTSTYTGDESAGFEGSEDRDGGYYPGILREVEWRDDGVDYGVDEFLREYE